MLALLALVLLAALAVSRTCGSAQQEVSQDEAVALATEEAGFEPCSESGCVVVRALRQGIPSRLYWLVGLAEAIDENGNQIGTKSFLVDVTTGDVTRRT
jgi:hypothetical protein